MLKHVLGKELGVDITYLSLGIDLLDFNLVRFQV